MQFPLQVLHMGIDEVEIVIAHSLLAGEVLGDGVL
jgi:hypothetical protein